MRSPTRRRRSARTSLLIEDSAASNSKKKIQIANQETALEAVMDSQQMQGAVTDGQVPDTITVNQAMTGDSATAFFTPVRSSEPVAAPARTRVPTGTV